MRSIHRRRGCTPIRRMDRNPIQCCRDSCHTSPSHSPQIRKGSSPNCCPCRGSCSIPSSIPSSTPSDCHKGCKGRKILENRENSRHRRNFQMDRMDWGQTLQRRKATCNPVTWISLSNSGVHIQSRFGSCPPLWCRCLLRRCTPLAHRRRPNTLHPSQKSHHATNTIRHLPSSTCVWTGIHIRWTRSK